MIAPTQASAGGAFQETLCVVSELADISPDDDLQYAFDTFSWYRHLYQESQQVLTPQTLEATRLNNDTSAARAAALLAEVAAELAEFEEEVQAAISSNKRTGDVSASHKKKGPTQHGKGIGKRGLHEALSLRSLQGGRLSSKGN